MEVLIWFGTGEDKLETFSVSFVAPVTRLNSILICNSSSIKVRGSEVCFRYHPSHWGGLENGDALGPACLICNASTNTTTALCCICILVASALPLQNCPPPPFSSCPLTPLSPPCPLALQCQVGASLQGLAASCSADGPGRGSVRLQQRRQRLK